MPAMLATVRIPQRTGLSKDIVENSFAFTGTTPPTAPNLVALTNALHDFYDHNDTAGDGSVAAYMSPCLDITVPWSIRWYDIGAFLDGSPHGGPFATTTFNIASAPFDPKGLPNQDACVLSIEGPTAPALVPGSGNVPTDDRAQDEGAPAFHTGTFRAQERVRGRLYIGPLNNSSSVMVLPGEPRVNPLFRNALKAAAIKLITDAAVAAVWGVWSRRNATIAPVIKGFIDDRFDAQRRRESAATSRLLFP